MDIGKLDVFTFFLTDIALPGAKEKNNVKKVKDIESWLKISSDLREEKRNSKNELNTLLGFSSSENLKKMEKSDEKSKIEKRRLSGDHNGMDQDNKKLKLIDTEDGKIEAKRKSKDDDNFKNPTKKSSELSEEGEKIKEKSDEKIKRKLSADQNETDQVDKKPKLFDTSETGKIEANVNSKDEDEKVVTVDVLTLSWEELRMKYNLKHLHCNIKIKNDRKMYKSFIKMQEKIDAKARADAEKKENELNSKLKELDEKSQHIDEQPADKVEKVMPLVLKIDGNKTGENGDSRSRSASRSVSRSVSRSRSRSVSRSPSRSVSRSPSP